MTGESTGESLTHKLLRSHLVAGELVPGTDITVAVDQVLIEDATGTMCAMQYEMLAAGSETADEVQVPLAVMYVDHNVLQMKEVRGHLADGQVADWQVTVKIGFRLDDTE